MRVYRGTRAELNSCNCCSKGKVRANGTGLDFPYEEVTVIEAKGISMRLCDECLDELKSKI